VHTTTFLEQVDRTHRKRIPVTSLARTGIDLALEIPELAPTLVDHLIVRRKLPIPSWKIAWTRWA
jgi:predicted phosphoribosyltransferase